MLNGYYAYSFYIGSYFLSNQWTNVNSGELYTGGDIMACFLGIIYGVFSLGLAVPNFQSIAEGKLAGKMAFDIIDRVPKIKLDQEDGEEVGELKGKIEFKNVSFSYPTR